MSNRGYPDNDGSRDPGGRNGEGRERPSIRDVLGTTMIPETVAEQRSGTRVNNMTDLEGNESRVPFPGPVDGNADSRGYLSAAYPASSGSDGTG